MASRSIKVAVSVTETRQFRRLVQLLDDVENLARVNADEELGELVEDARADLLDQYTEDEA